LSDWVIERIEKAITTLPQIAKSLNLSITQSLNHQ